MGTGDSRWSCADHRDSMRISTCPLPPAQQRLAMTGRRAPTRHVAGKHLLQADGGKGFGPVMFGQEAFEGADGNRCVDLSPPASILTRGAASPTANRRDGIRRTGNSVRFRQAPFGNKLDVASSVRLDWASVEAGDVLAKPPQISRLRIDHAATVTRRSLIARSAATETSGSDDAFSSQLFVWKQEIRPSSIRASCVSEGTLQGRVHRPLGNAAKAARARETELPLPGHDSTWRRRARAEMRSPMIV